MPRRSLAHERIRTEVTMAGTLAETPEDFGMSGVSRRRKLLYFQHAILPTLQADGVPQR